jgi:hypothetical protein
MAITINGTGSITGISAGGYPDGSITTDDLAANAVTAAKLATGAITVGALPSGTIINTAVFENSTRVGTPSATTTRQSLVTVSFNKTSSTSTLVFFGTIPGHENASGHVSCGVSYGTTSITGGWHYSYNSFAYAYIGAVAGRLAGHTTTGSQDFKVEYFSDDGASVKPWQVTNPNSTDDVRLNQQRSQLVIMEVEL